MIRFSTYCTGPSKPTLFRRLHNGFCIVLPHLPWQHTWCRRVLSVEVY